MPSVAPQVSTSPRRSCASACGAEVQAGATHARRLRRLGADLRAWRAVCTAATDPREVRTACGLLRAANAEALRALPDAGKGIENLAHRESLAAGLRQAWAAAKRPAEVKPLRRRRRAVAGIRCAEAAADRRATATWTAAPDTAAGRLAAKAACPDRALRIVDPSPAAGRAVRALAADRETLRSLRTWLPACASSRPRTCARATPDRRRRHP